MFEHNSIKCANLAFWFVTLYEYYTGWPIFSGQKFLLVGRCYNDLFITNVSFKTLNEQTKAGATDLCLFFLNKRF